MSQDQQNPEVPASPAPELPANEKPHILLKVETTENSVTIERAFVPPTGRFTPGESNIAVREVYNVVEGKLTMVSRKGGSYVPAHQVPDKVKFD